MTDAAPRRYSISELLRLHRTTVEQAATRMEWAPDWPLDRLMCEAADRLEQAEATLATVRDQSTKAVEFHRDMAARFAEDRDAKKHRLREAEATIAAQRAALEQVEWCWDGTEYRCSWCLYKKSNGHNPECHRGRALASALPPATPPEPR